MQADPVQREEAHLQDMLDSAKQAPGSSRTCCRTDRGWECDPGAVTREGP